MVDEEDDDCLLDEDGDSLAVHGEIKLQMATVGERVEEREGFEVDWGGLDAVR